MPRTEILPTNGRVNELSALPAYPTVERQTRREVALVQSRALIAKLTEDARAAVTHAALEHVGALTALETHLITVSPLGEARYRELVDSFTIAAGAAIRRFS